MAEGMANAIEGRTGTESCREKRVVNLDTFEAAGADHRGRKADRIEWVVTCEAAIGEDE